jgi:hypothetical protein
MDKVDEFKEFIKDNPHLKTRIDNKETSWRALYENFDISARNMNPLGRIIKSRTVLNQKIQVRKRPRQLEPDLVRY